MCDLRNCVRDYIDIWWLCLEKKSDFINSLLAHSFCGCGWRWCWVHIDAIGAYSSRVPATMWDNGTEMPVYGFDHSRSQSPKAAITNLQDLRDNSRRWGAHSDSWEGHIYKVKSLCSVLLCMCSEFSDGHWEVQNQWYGFFEHVFSKSGVTNASCSDRLLVGPGEHQLLHPKNTQYQKTDRKDRCWSVHHGVRIHIAYAIYTVSRGW